MHSTLRHPVAEVRGRRAALDELATLDPEVHYHRMVQLVVGRVFSDRLFTSALFGVAYWRQAAVPNVAQILSRRGTGDTLVATRKRTDDTLAFFGFVYRDGWQGDAAGATIDRMAAIHERFPAIRADDFRYTLASLCFEPVRIPQILGVPGLTDAEARALFLFWRDVGRRWGIDVPEEQDEFQVWMHDHEKRSYAFTPEAATIAQAIGDDFARRYFPGPLRPLGWEILRAMSDQPLLDAVGERPATPAMRTVTALFVRAYVKARRTVPGPGGDRLIGPWTKGYSRARDALTSADLGPEWAADITPASRKHATAGRQG